MPARPKRASASTRAVAHIGPWSILVTQCEMTGNSQLRARSPRDRLLDAIRIEPGLSTNGLHKKVGDAWGTIAEALITLQKDGEIHIRQEPFCGRIVKRYYPGAAA